MLGLASLFQLHGLEAFREPYALAAFEADRFTMIIAAIAARRATCFASEEWKHGPWLVAHAPKAPRQYLIDNATEIPQLYLDLIRLLGTKDEALRATLCVRLEMSMNSLLQKFHKWRLDFKSQHKPQVREVEIPTQQQQECGFATNLSFENEDYAYTFIIYHAALIILLELWKTLRRSISTGHSGNHNAVTRTQDLEINDIEATSPSTSSLVSQSHIAALDICRILPQYITPSGSLIHPIAFVVPIRMALVVFRQDGESVKRTWLEGLIRQISESQEGWEIGRYAMQGFVLSGATTSGA